MPDIRHRLLRQIAPLFLLLLPSCVSAIPPVGEASNYASSGEQLTIDLSGGIATTAEWKSNTVNCSDDNYHCILIPDRMVLAFTKSCSNAGREGAPLAPLGGLIRVAPMPHLAPPSGSYIVKSFPKVLLFYYAGHGLKEVRIVRNSPYDKGFDPNSYDARFSVVTSDRKDLFVCS